TMPFAVREAGLLEGIAAGEMVDFALVVDDSTSYIEKIGIHHYEGTEQDPLAAGRLKMLGGLADKTTPIELKIGEHVPDFSLIDQTGRGAALSQYAGKVVAITFTYTHCALPNFCFRIANSFRALQKRFAPQMGQELILMTITFDPIHDRPEVMAKYGIT